ncbi:MAG: sigma-54 dependent transcriptional regulator [Acidobacteriota bacterium]
MSSSTAARRAGRGRILVLDDDRALLRMTSEFLRSIGHDVEEVSTLEQARMRVKARPYDVVLTDLVLDRGTGLELLKDVRDAEMRCEVIIMTGHGGVDAAIEAIKGGAYDFVTKPVSLARLQIDVDKALEKVRLQDDLRELSRDSRTRFGGLTGMSSTMRSLFALLDRVSAADSNVLLLGESGTGKDVAARAIHDASPRRNGPFVAVHCGALPAELLESELFGHVRGSFTSADRDRKGLFLAANGGTIFLDELGTAPLSVQVKLLRVLQERVVRPVGSESASPVDVRVVAATNADLDVEIAAGRFRQDLYYRLATFVVELPPLRDRREDLPVLVAELMERIATRTGRRVTLSAGALGRLVAYDWPGNIRELEHVLEQATILAHGTTVRSEDLALATPGPAEKIMTLEELESGHIRRVIGICAGNKQRAARMLGIPRASLYRKLERYGIEEPRLKAPDHASIPTPASTGSATSAAVPARPDFAS